MFLCSNWDDISDLPAASVARPIRRSLRSSVSHRRASSSSLVCRRHLVNNPAVAAWTLTTARFLLTRVIEQRIATIQGRNWSIMGNQVDGPVAYWLREENVTVDMRTISGWPQPSSHFVSSLFIDHGAAGNHWSGFLRVHLPPRSCFCSCCHKPSKVVGERSCSVVFLQISGRSCGRRCSFIASVDRTVSKQYSRGRLCNHDTVNSFCILVKLNFGQEEL